MKVPLLNGEVSCGRALRFFLKPVELGRLARPVGQSEGIWIAQTANLIWGKLVRLRAKWDFHNAHGYLRGEASGHLGTSAASRIVAIEHQSELSEVMLEKRLLPKRKGTSHQRNDAR
jgi:hypothetical protein